MGRALRSNRSHTAEHEASSHHGTTSPSQPQQAQPGPPTPSVVEHVHEQSVQGITPNVDDLSAAKRPARIIKEPMVFVTKTEVEALAQHEKKDLLQ